MLPFDELAALVSAQLMAEGTAKGQPLIAAIGTVNACLVVTDNEKDFRNAVDFFNLLRPNSGVGRDGHSLNQPQTYRLKDVGHSQSSILRTTRGGLGVRLKPPTKPRLDPGALIVRKVVVGIVNGDTMGQRLTPMP